VNSIEKTKWEVKKEDNARHRILYARRFINAFRGMYIFGKTTKHLFVHLFAALLVVFLGFYFRISGIEWMLIVFAIGLVLISEAFNTAIEIDIDLTSPEYHPYARDTKDVSASAVLLAVFVAIIVGLIIFLPKMFY